MAIGYTRMDEGDQKVPKLEVPSDRLGDNYRALLTARFSGLGFRGLGYYPRVLGIVTSLNHHIVTPNIRNLHSSKKRYLRPAGLRNLDNFSYQIIGDL